MTGPLVILAILSLGGGYYFNIPHYLEGMFQTGEEGNVLFLQIISVVTAVFGIAVAGHLYLGKNNMAESLARTFKHSYEIIYNKYFVDEIYDAAVVKPTIGLSRVVLWRFMDNAIVDGLVNGTASQTRNMGNLLRRAQSGSIRSYAAWVVFGSVLLIFAMAVLGVTQ
jgi:NADH-quinone oxidoreductase subunit L